MRTSVLSLLLALAFAASLGAQSFLGTIRGTVVDPQGGAVKGAAVLITDEATNTPRSVDTDAEGRYEAANLKPGLTEMIVHLGRDDAELQAVTVNHEPYGSAWRQRDYDVVTSPEFRKALQDNNVVLVTWRELQRAAQTP